MAAKQHKKAAVRQKSEADIRPVPKEVREVWYAHRKPEIEIAPNYRKKWTDEEVERVIQATPEEFSSYWELARELNRSVGALHRKKQIVIELLEARPYALEMARSGLPKRHDYKHVYQILSEKGYLAMPMVECRKYARHLPKPSSGWRGDHTQAVLAARRGNRRSRKT